MEGSPQLFFTSGSQFPLTLVYIYICLLVLSSLFGRFLGANPFRFEKGPMEGSPITSLHLFPSAFKCFFQQFCYICLPLSFFGAVPSSLYLSPNDLWSSGAVLGADPFAAGKVLWKVPQLFFTSGDPGSPKSSLDLPRSLFWFSGAVSCRRSIFRKGSAEGSHPTLLYICFPIFAGPVEAFLPTIF